MYVGMKLLDCMVSMCNFMRNYQTSFQSACIVLQFLRQLTRAPVSLHAKLVIVFYFIHLLVTKLVSHLL